MVATPIDIPDLALVVLIGPSGAGKSTFARRHFAETEVVSSDRCRALVADDENDQSATAAAFEVLHRIVDGRLALGRLAVVDATNVEAHARRALLDLARARHVAAVAVVFDLPLERCLERNAARTDRVLPDEVVRRQHDHLRRSQPRLRGEGFRPIITLTAPDQVESVSVERHRLWCDRRDERGPFDLVGDVHGCHRELLELVARLGYPVDDTGRVGPHPEGRRLVLLGDLVDRGPAIADTLRTAMQITDDGIGFSVLGNHEDKVRRALAGRDVRVSGGLAQSLRQLEAETPAFREQVAGYLGGLVSHAVLDGGDLVAAHGGLPEEFHGRSCGEERSFALFGGPTGELDEAGRPVRQPWARDYRGRALVVYGHTPVKEPRWEHNTVGIDTGCVFGGALTALRYPERTLVSVPAAEPYYQPPGPPGVRERVL